MATEPSPSPRPADPARVAPIPPRPSEVPFALLAHPVVQVLRFLTKAALAWFLAAEELGDAMAVGLFAFLAQHLSLFGLDDAVVFAPRLTLGLWRALRRFLNLTGAVLTVAVAASGLLLAPLMGAPELKVLALVLAPTVWIGNLAVLPNALLVRQRRFRAVFTIDLCSVAAFAVVTLALSASGAGAWSLVGGWYANAALAVVSSHVLARGSLPAESGESAETRRTLRYGAHLMGASLLGFGGERLDSFAIGIGIGRAALGLYEWALQLSQFAVQYASNLSERFLFPTLARDRRNAPSAMARSFREAIRLCNTFVLPLHVAMSVAAVPFVRGFLPRDWLPAGRLLSVLALAAAWRSLDVVSLAALKAAGRSAAVLRLSAIRLGLLAVAVALTVWTGDILALALGVLAARSLGALLTLTAAGRLPEIQADGVRRVSSAGLPCFLAWCAAYLPAAWIIGASLADSPRLQLAATVSAALAVWLALRAFIDREALLREWQHLYRELSAAFGGRG